MQGDKSENTYSRVCYSFCGSWFTYSEKVNNQYTEQETNAHQQNNIKQIFQT